MAVLIALTMVVFLAAVAFSLDVAYMQLTRTQLRTSTDAAARAGGEALARLQNKAAARQAARNLAAVNQVAGEPLLLDDADIVFGRSTPQRDGTWLFTPSEDAPNALRVFGRRTNDSLSGSVGLFFGRIFGTHSFQPTQTATVVRFDRDICLVVDRSSSMKLRIDETSGLMSTRDSRFCHPPNMVESRWAAVCAAVEGFLEELDGTPHLEHVGLVSYASDYTRCDYTNRASETNQPLTDDTDLVRNAMQAITASVFNGGTDIPAGIDQGAVALTDPATSRRFARRTMVVLTDGYATQGRSPALAAQDAQAEDIVVHTVTFSVNADQDAMRAVSEAGHGKHYHAPDAEALEQIFREIALSMLVVFTQ